MTARASGRARGHATQVTMFHAVAPGGGGGSADPWRAAYRVRLTVAASTGHRSSWSTGVSRRVGIGAAVDRILAADGHRLLLAGLPATTTPSPTGRNPVGVPALLAELGKTTGHVTSADLLDPGHPGGPGRQGGTPAPAKLDAVVAASLLHPRRLGELDATEIDRHLLVNVRAAPAARPTPSPPPSPPGRRPADVLLHGQRLGPMPDELASRPARPPWRTSPRGSRSY